MSHTRISILPSQASAKAKLYEELLTDEENLTSTQHDRIFIGRPAVFTQSQMELEFKRLERVIFEEPEAIREVINQIVPMQPVIQAALAN